MVRAIVFRLESRARASHNFMQIPPTSTLTICNIVVIIIVIIIEFGTHFTHIKLETYAGWVAHTIRCEFLPPCIFVLVF